MTGCPDKPRVLRHRRSLVLLAMCTGAGCVELGLVTPIGDGGGSSNGGGTTTDPGPLAATLSVSNLTPQLNEEVLMICRVSGGDGDGATFGFTSSSQPATGLSTNSATGTATFIVTESDLNVTFRFSCTATTGAGESASSPDRLVTPTGA